MIKESYLKKLTQEEAMVMLSEQAEFISKARRVLPLIDAKKIKYPNWKAICPKSGCEITLDIIKEELQAYLEEAEEEVAQLNAHIETLVPIEPKRKPKSIQVAMEI